MISWKCRESPLHSLDPRVKIVFLAVFTAALVAFRSPQASLVEVASALALYAAARIGLREAWPDMRAILPLALLAVPVQALAHPGTEAFSIWLVRFTWEGLLFGAQMAVSLSCAIAVALLFAYTTRASDIAGALSALGAPPRLCFSLALSLQFTSILSSDIWSVRAAQASRGGRLSSPGSLMPFLVPVAHKALSRAEALSVSLDARGFDPDRKPEFFGRMRARDYALALGGALMVACIALAQSASVF
jgi:energy-coupling factor transporter transmembrane protein EcfT